MKAEATQEQPELIGEAEYHTLEQTLMESDRGRRFLKEFLNRHKTPETTEILGAIHRLEKVVTRERKVPDLDKIRLDIGEMHEAIERTKAEISNIKAEGEESNRFVDASHELDLIVTQTEGATQNILEAAEQIQEKAWVLRENGADNATCDEIDASATEIFMACSFQDLTGQRTNKVVQVLRYLESRINAMIGIWGIEEREADESAGPVDSRPDSHLLNGPQREGDGVSQNNVDELMSVSDDVFDAAIKATDAASDTPVHASDADVDAIMASAGASDAGDDTSGDGEPMDASAIDDMFAAPAAADAAPEEDVAEVAAAEAEETGTDDADATLDEDAIEMLFDAEVNAEAEEAKAETEAEAEAEAEADADWELTAEAAEEDGEDALKSLTEAERQALFN
ncbi:protein phosphatase CheZ [Roseibium sp.]|uniref:protein phosphatase CheZ n=1 Tax=Roseibium sp. TaxID=1936156 RepID=UPI00326472D8